MHFNPIALKVDGNISLETDTLSQTLLLSRDAFINFMHAIQIFTMIMYTKIKSLESQNTPFLPTNTMRKFDDLSAGYQFLFGRVVMSDQKAEV